MKLIDSVFHETLEKIITQNENQNVDDKNVTNLDKHACLLNHLVSPFIKVSIVARWTCPYLLRLPRQGPS